MSEAPAGPVPGTPLPYRLLTGPDNREFCERVSAALAEGYRLHGSPSLTFNGETVIAAQAVVLAHPAADPDADAGPEAGLRQGRPPQRRG